MLRRFYRRLQNVPVVRNLNVISGMERKVREQLELIHRGQQEAFVGSLLGQERYRDPKRLAGSEFQVCSQNGEDGILAEIFRRIGTKDRTFLEIGVGNGRENNTAYLLAKGWSGCWVEGDRQFSGEIRNHFRSRISEGSLKLIELFVSAENISPTLKSHGVPEELDLLSIDVDQNTYWIWSALSHLRARVVVVEYNATLPPSFDWKVEYDPRACWDGTFRYGASLKAYETLGHRLGYHLVGCDLHGINAFFVRQDLCEGKFCEPYDSLNHYEPPRYWLIRVSGHPKGYL